MAWARAEWRRQWRSLTALAIVLGLAGAVVLTAAAGSVRTGSAYDRLVARTARYDVQVQDDAEGAPLLPKLAGLPGVVASDRVSFTFQALARHGATAIDSMILVAGEHDGFGRRFDRPVLESGRMPDPRRPSEVLLNNIGAAALGAEVGDVITVRPLTQEQFFASVFEGQAPDDDARSRLTLKVAGIGRLPDDADAPDPAAIISSRLFETEDIGRFDNQVWVRLAEGQDGVDDFIAAAEARPEHSAGDVSFTRARDSDDRVIDAIAVQRVGLEVFALVALVVVAVAGGQAVSRQLASSGDDDATLLALGLGRADRVAALSLPFVAVALVAGAVGGVGTVVSSPILPVGFAGRIEADTGVYVYPAILVSGVAGLAAFIVVVAALTALVRTHRHAGQGDASERPSMVASAAAAAGAGPSTVTGLRLALEAGKGRARLPVRSTLAGVILGAAGVTAVLTFGASLHTILTEPALHGRSWDAAIPLGEDEEAAEQIAAQLPKDVTAAALADQRSVTIGGEDLVGASFRSLRGSIDLRYLEGRAPAASDEVAIGPDGLDRMGASVGDTVTALAPEGRRVRLEVVGSPVVPIEETYDRIAVFAENGLARLERSEGGRNVYVRTKGSPEAALAPLGGIEIDRPTLPVSLANLEEARSIPAALAQFLGALALATLIHALLVGLRRRRRDIAVLRVLGLRGRQVHGLVAVQATALAVIGAAIGIPIGVAAGRLVWSQFAEGLNVVVQPDVPVLETVAVALGGLVLANVVALPRAWFARRLAPSAVLRTE